MPITWFSTNKTLNVYITKPLRIYGSTSEFETILHTPVGTALKDYYLLVRV